jgi:methylated-DNA-[protein]-cysteine S-methyltransferase
VQHAIERMIELLAGKPNALHDVVLDLDGVPRIQPRRLRHRAHHSAGPDHDLWRHRQKLGGVELSRDVGQALGRNPCPIVVPCHRVLAPAASPAASPPMAAWCTKLKMLAIEGAA